MEWDSRSKRFCGTPKRADVDLIAMGTHGHSGLSEVLLGPVAEGVVRDAPSPVLTVRHRERARA